MGPLPYLLAIHSSSYREFLRATAASKTVPAISNQLHGLDPFFPIINGNAAGIRPATVVNLTFDIKSAFHARDMPSPYRCVEKFALIICNDSSSAGDQDLGNKSLRSLMTLHLALDFRTYIVQLHRRSPGVFN